MLTVIVSNKNDEFTKYSHDLFYLGYNFDAISCESCKAFFRRNAMKSIV